MVPLMGGQLDLVPGPTRRRFCFAPGCCTHAGVEMQCCLLCARSGGVEVCGDVCTVAFEGERECQWLREVGA